MRRTAPTDDPVTAAQYVDLKSWLPSDILTKVDRTAMANSLEVRVPMLDHTFVDWALGLPSAVNRRGSEGKILLKRAFGRLVPPECAAPPQAGLFRAAGALVPGHDGPASGPEAQFQRRAWPRRTISIPTPSTD